MTTLNGVLAKIFAPAQSTIDSAEAQAKQGFAIIAGELLIVILLLVIIAIRKSR